ncbi:ankyrin repeat domain-containing 50 isoform X2 [Chlorella sorokiniana]|uniref:Ankyrin repeat domain-containing 50 isoform X2 n=1 Tax=Chlorella sorokiniana TaxID=3076 RepID=A0A2P6U2E6_CHLSO|nr:ankyrin repeat domain-containing 50 isoform X2 [Chlorella sorokiniana]|eukprot:PRW60479.1 ankyrin repeat domain-containing 50 isoform X2 [Chlorella sorokiniana]
MVAALVAGGADINAPVEADPCHLPAYTLLHWAAYSNAVDAIQVLAACGADLEVRDATVDNSSLGRWTEFVGGGQTPLMVAAANGHVEAVEALIAAGCNANAGTTDWGSWSPKGATALEFAVVGPGSGCQPGAQNPEGLPAVVNALLAAGAVDVEYALEAALHRHASEEMLAALEAAVDDDSEEDEDEESGSDSD